MYKKSRWSDFSVHFGFRLHDCLKETVNWRLPPCRVLTYHNVKHAAMVRFFITATKITLQVRGADS